MLAHLSAAALLLLAVQSAAQIISVTVDNVTAPITDTKSSQGERYTLSSKVKSLEITCRVNSSVNLTQVNLNWEWRNTSANATVSGSRTSITPNVAADGRTATSVLKIKYPQKYDLTTYVCIVNGTNATGGFVSVPLLTMSVNGVNEYDTSPWPGENLVIKCVVQGNPEGNVRWTKSVDSTFSVVDNNTIYMNSVSYENDRGYVTCTSTNLQGTNTATMFLRIKNPNSYLAPLIATVIEIVLIVLVCVAYELYDQKRRRTSVADGVKSD